MIYCDTPIVEYNLRVWNFQPGGRGIEKAKEGLHGRKMYGIEKEVALQEKQTGDVDRQLDETTRELHREREKLMAAIRMSGDLIFEYDIVNDKMYYAGPGEGILYSRRITEGYTDQLLKEAGNRTETVEQQLAEALRSGKPDIYIELCKTDAEGKPRWVKVIGQTFMMKRENRSGFWERSVTLMTRRKRVGTAGKISERFP